MDIPTNLILFALGVACAVLGWFARQLFTAVDKLKDDLSLLREHIAKDYIRYDRLQDALKPLMEGIGEINDALLRKVDKP